jgi:hypothetical protein
MRKRILGVRLTAIAPHNLLIAPVVLAGEQDSFPQLMLSQMGTGSGIRANSHRKSRRPKDAACVAALKKLLANGFMKLEERIVIP